MPKQECSREEGFASAAYFLAGLAAGGALALLTTPYAGRDLRGKIKAGADCGKDQLHKRVDELKDRARDVAGGVLQKAEEAIRSSKEKVEQHLGGATQAGKDAYRASLTEGVVR